MRLLLVFTVLASAFAFAQTARPPAAGDVHDAGVVDAGAPDPVPDDTRAQPDAVAPRPDATPPAPDPSSPVTTPPAAPARDPDATGATTAPPAAPRVDDTAPAVDGTGARVDPDSVPNPAGDAAAAPAAAVKGERPNGLGFGGVPAVNYDSDNGLGFGLIASLYFHDGETDPYRAAVTLQIFMTSKLVQDHNIQVDWLKVLDFPLRLNLRVGYLQSLTQNYCGLGGTVTCDPDVAHARGREQGLAGKSLDAFAHDYYLRRFINPYGLVNVRFALLDRPATSAAGKLRVEVLGGYRGFYFIPGNWFDDDGDGAPDLHPYPGSLYAQEFPGGEPGYSSVIQGGVMVDTRDNEPAPTEGVWLEASARGSSPVWGSRWTWAGANTVLRGYVPLVRLDDGSKPLVLASRLMGDFILGDPPIQELARVGGSVDSYAFGGADIGRGIRAQRFMGKLRVMNQTELRWRFFDFSLFEQLFAFTAAGFVDSGIVAAEIAEPADTMGVAVGGGGGLRLSWNENFVIRADVATSPYENWAPAVYIVVNNPF